MPCRRANPSESPDIYDASLKGTTYRVYRYMYRAGKPVRVNDVQRDLKLSSPSVAQYHLKKLLRLGLVKEVPEGYAIDKVIYENMVRIGRVTIPFQAAYIAFFAACVIGTGDIPQAGSTDLDVRLRARRHRRCPSCFCIRNVEDAHPPQVIPTAQAVTSFGFVVKSLLSSSLSML